MVHARSIRLPDLPSSPREAHQRHGKVAALIEQEEDDLSSALKDLYATRGADQPLPPTLHLGSTEARRTGEDLLGLYLDARAMKEEQAVLRDWRTWRAALADTGLRPAAPAAEAQAAAILEHLSGPRRAEYLRLKKRFSRRRALYWENQRDPITMGWMQTPGIVDWEQWDQELDETANRVTLAAWAAPQLCESWRPLQARLEADSARLLELEARQRIPDPGLRQLLLHAKVVHLERIRSALWFCGKVWAEMSSSTPPPPLASAHPGALAREGS